MPNPKGKRKKRGPHLSSGPKAEVTVPVIRAHQSPLNESQWLVTMECGHERWVTSAKEPKEAHCHACEAKARGDSWGWGAGPEGKAGGNRRSPEPGPKAQGKGSDDGGDAT